MTGLFRDRLAGIIYDCDGVMIDSAAANTFLYNRVLAELGLPPITPEQKVYAFQATYKQALRFLVPERLHDKIEAATRTVDYDREVLPKIRLMPDYRKFVETAAAHGLRQAVDTNRTDFGAWRIIDGFGLQGFFEPVITSTNTAPKPSGEGVTKICAAWGCQPGQVLFVGDSADDGAAARAGGTVFAAFGPGTLEGNIKAVDWRSLARLLWQQDLS